MTCCGWCKADLDFPVSLSRMLLFKVEPDMLCSFCRESLVDLSACETCSSCCRVMKKKEICGDCIQWRKQYPDLSCGHKALYAYNDLAAEIMNEFKYKGDCELAYLFKQEIRQALKAFPLKTCFIPVPSSNENLSFRGFNQVELLLEVSGIAYRRGLISLRSNGSQAHKKRNERIHSEQPFFLDPAEKNFLRGRPVVIVDDVYTTGRTLYHAAEVVCSSQPSSLQTFSLFR